MISGWCNAQIALSVRSIIRINRSRKYETSRSKPIRATSRPRPSHRATQLIGISFFQVVRQDPAAGGGGRRKRGTHLRALRIRGHRRQIAHRALAQLHVGPTTHGLLIYFRLPVSPSARRYQYLIAACSFARPNIINSLSPHARSFLSFTTLALKREIFLLFKAWAVAIWNALPQNPRFV